MVDLYTFTNIEGETDTGAHEGDKDITPKVTQKGKGAANAAKVAASIDNRECLFRR